MFRSSPSDATAPNAARIAAANGLVNGPDQRAAVNGLDQRAAVNGLDQRAAVNGLDQRAAVNGLDQRAAVNGLDQRAAVNGLDQRAAVNGLDQRAAVNGLDQRAAVNGLLAILAGAIFLAACGAPLDSAMAQRKRRFGKNSPAQQRELDALLTDVIRYLGKQPPEPFVEAGNFFGKVLLKPPAEDAIDEPPPAPGQFGLYVLGGLQNAQIRRLSDLAREQLAAVAACEAKQRKAFAMILDLQQQERRNRAMERELQTLGKEIGLLESTMGLAQAHAFLAVNESMSPDQREYLALLRRAPDTGSLKNPQVAKISEQASRLDPKLRLMVLKMAERCCLYLTGAAEQNVASLTRRRRTDPESDEAEQKMGVLTALNPAQKQGLSSLVTAQTRLKQDAQARRTQVAMLLDGLKLKQNVDDRRLAAPAGAMGEADIALLASRLQGLAGFTESLSNAQRAFIQNNVLTP